MITLSFAPKAAETSTKKNSGRRSVIGRLVAWMWKVSERSQMMNTKPFDGIL